jgi:prepilin-type N-terminal cleavage/methylation domain-containing protein
MKTAHRPRSCGFTLLEVMLALMVFGIAVVALVGAINGVGNASTESRLYREVQAKLDSLMTEMTRMPQDPASLSSDKSEEKTVKENGVEYRLKKAPVDLSNIDGQTLPDMYSVKGVAHWKESGFDQEMTAETLLYPPLYAPAQ